MNRQQEIKVEFIDKMGSDKRIWHAARVSFAKWDDSEEITEADKGLLKYLATGPYQNQSVMIGKNRQRLIPILHLLRMRHYLSALLFPCYNVNLA